MTGVPESGSGYGDGDPARGAMQAVHELFRQNPGATVAEIRQVPGYEQIPERVRRAIEALSLSERLFLHQVFDELIGTGFSIEQTGIRGY